MREREGGEKGMISYDMKQGREGESEYPIKVHIEQFKFKQKI